MATYSEAVDKDKKERDAAGIEPGKKRGIAVLTPTLGMMSMWWHTAMIDLIFPLNMGKAFIPCMDRIGGEIAEVRNRLVMMAFTMEQRANCVLDSILWVDDDVIVNRAVLLALAAHDRDIAAGVYFCKGDVGNEPLIFEGPSCGALKFRPNEVFEAWGWPLGLSLIKADVFKHMKEDLDLGVDKYGSPAWYKVPEFGVRDGEIVTGGTEDFHFFGNAAKLGYRPLIDCTKFAFGWHYDANKKTAYPKKQWQQREKMEPIIWETKEGEVIWD